MVKTHTAAPKKVIRDTRPPPSDHNEGPSDDDILFHLGQIKKAEGVKKEAAAAFKKVNQRASNIGITLEDLADARMMLEMGPDKAFAKQKRRMRYMRVLQVPVGGQLQLFDNPVEANAITQETLLKEAFMWGHNLGVADEPPDWQKYQQNSDLGQEHHRGWYDGQEVYARLTSNNAAAATKEAEDLQKSADDKLKAMADKKAEKEKAAADKAAAKAAKTAEAPPARGRKKAATTDEAAAKAAIGDALQH